MKLFPLIYRILGRKDYTQKKQNKLKGKIHKTDALISTNLNFENHKIEKTNPSNNKLLKNKPNEHEEAVDHFENVLRINDDKWQAYHYKGVCIIQQKEYERALQVFIEGASRYPGQARFYVDQALAYIMMRETDQAREKLRGALAIDESLRDVINNTPEFSGLL